MPAPKLTTAQRCAVARAYTDGVKVEAIGAQYGISSGGVSYIAKSYGLPVRGRGGRKPQSRRRVFETHYWLRASQSQYANWLRIFSRYLLSTKGPPP